MTRIAIQWQVDFNNVDWMEKVSDTGGEDIDGQGHHLQTAKQPRGSDPNADSGNVAAKRGNHPLPKHVALPYWEVVPQQPANVLPMVAA
jgi:hypothetical protein